MPKTLSTHGLNKQVNTWSRACIQCQASKIQTHIEASLKTFSVPARIFEHIDVDLVGSPPPSQLFAVFHIPPNYRRSIYAMAEGDITQGLYHYNYRALIANWITHFGVAAKITSDLSTLGLDCRVVWHKASSYYGIPSAVQ